MTDVAVFFSMAHFIVYTDPAEHSLHLIPGLFGFDWVATEYKPGLIMSYKV